MSLKGSRRSSLFSHSCAWRPFLPHGPDAQRSRDLSAWTGEGRCGSTQFHCTARGAKPIHGLFLSSPWQGGLQQYMRDPASHRAPPPKTQVIPLPAGLAHCRVRLNTLQLSDTSQPSLGSRSCLACWELGFPHATLCDNDKDVFGLQAPMLPAAALEALLVRPHLLLKG